VFRQTRSQDGLRTASILVDDFDGDGDGDIVKLPNGGFPGEILLNDGAMGFTPAPLNLDTSYYITGAAGDIAGTELPDIVYYDDGFKNDAPTRVRWAVNTTPGGCESDINHDGAVNSQDFFDFLTCFFDPTCLQADFNRDDGVNSQDFFDFMAAFLAGC
jgi:hypothetical protein